MDDVARGNLPAAHDSLYHTLSERFPDVRLIGDARPPRSVEAAVTESQEVGRAI
jgi:hypothetical protein